MEEKVYKLLENLNIDYEKVNHPALYTAEDNEKYKIKFNGIVCKNLFVKNKDKSHYYLITMPLEKRVSLNNIQEKLHETRLSFGHEDLLFEKLKIRSGAVSILNIIEVENTDVRFIIDKSLLKVNKVGFHPNVNTSTVLFAPKEIETILKKYNSQYEFIEL